MMQAAIYAAVITGTVVITAYFALHAATFIFAYVMWCFGRSFIGQEVSFRTFWNDIFPYPGGKPEKEDGD